MECIVCLGSEHAQKKRTLENRVACHSKEQSLRPAQRSELPRSTSEAGPLLVVLTRERRRRKKAHQSRSAGRGQINKIWEAVLSQQAILAELLRECSALPSLPVVSPTAPSASLQTVTDEIDDMLSITASEEVDDQLVLPSDDAESDMPVAQLSLSDEQRATAVLQVPWPAVQTKRRSIYDEQLTVTPAIPPVHSDFLYELQSTWEHPATAVAVSCSMDALYRVSGADNLGLTHFPPAETPIASLVQPANLLGSYNIILVAYQAHLIGSIADTRKPSSLQLDKLRLISRNLLRLSKLSGQAIGRNLAALVAARRQLWLSQARVLNRDKTALLDAPVTPSHTFGPAVDKML
ncbi:UNVERIFIED_CONTAM: hypothetical protein FKN15_014488 [Acipenser sinensis]